MINTSIISAKLSQHRDTLLFAGLWLWMGIMPVGDVKTAAWHQYFTVLLSVAPIMLPVVAFSLVKSTLRQYRLLVPLFYGMCLPVISELLSLLMPDRYDFFTLISISASCALLEVLLVVNRYYRQRVQHITWIKKIGLENAVLVSIILVALAISVMAVSSMDDPKYQSPNQLLIGFEFSIVKLFKYWWRFMGLFAQFLLMYLSGYLFFFINSHFLVSKVLKRQGLVVYLLSVLGVVALLYPVIAQLLIQMPMNKIFGRDIFPANPFSFENAFGALGIMFASLPVVLALQWAKQNSRIVSLEKEKTQTELDLLKQQLNPHFFFNTLNNLYALSLQGSKKTSESILQLSELMRYVIYKGQETAVPLAQELKYIKDYIQLQQMRLQKPLRFTFTQDVANDAITVAPLLLIVLVENAFKHGIEPAEDEATLTIHLTCTTDKLHFTCENSVESHEPASDGGIGLLNLKRRLELLYPGKYQLQTGLKNDSFKADLSLQLL